MDTQCKPSETIAAYDGLVERALEVISEAPYGEYVSETEFVRLTVEGDEATLSWPEGESDNSGYGSILSHKVTFQAHLLTMADDDFEQWKIEAKRADEQLVAQRLAELLAQKEEAERRVFAQLKAKYGES